MEVGKYLSDNGKLDNGRAWLFTWKRKTQRR